MDQSNSSPRAGQIIRDTYRLVRLIGKGGMGEVYEAQHVSLARRFAIKLLSSDYASDQEALTRFHREANIAASLGSPNIIEVFDFNKMQDGGYFMAMEYLDGQNMRELFAKKGSYTAEKWLPLFEQVCEGLASAHKAGIVHRDLKPENLFVIIGKKGTEVVKILDFGVSKIRSSVTLHTRVGTLLGTPNYMAPEQASGDNDRVDSRSDIFALGAITYEALTGRIAFDSPNLMSLVIKICQDEPEPINRLTSAVPPGAAKIVYKALSKDPAKRYQDVMDFFNDFRQAACAAAMPARAVSAPSPQQEATHHTMADKSTLAAGLAGIGSLDGKGSPRPGESQPSQVADQSAIATEHVPRTTTLSASAASTDVMTLPSSRRKTLVALTIGAVSLVALVLVLFFTLHGRNKSSDRPGSGAPPHSRAGKAETSAKDALGSMSVAAAGDAGAPVSTRPLPEADASVTASKIPPMKAGPSRRQHRKASVKSRKARQRDTRKSGMQWAE